MTVHYHQGNGKYTDALLQTLITHHNKELISGYSIVLSSLKDIHYNTQYHLSAADTLTIIGKGTTNETIDLGAHFNAKTSIKTINSTYNVTKGSQNYKALGRSIAIYMGIYSSVKSGMTTTLAAVKTTFTVGGAILINAGLTVSIGVIRLKYYFGGTISTLGVRTRIAAKYKESIHSSTKKRNTKIQNSQNCINQQEEMSIYSRFIPSPPPFLPPRPFRGRIEINKEDSDNEQYSKLNFA